MEFQSAEQILAETCGTAGCHDDSPNQSGLDLLSPDVASRVVGIAATGKGCTDRTLVVAGDLDGSYLLDKVLNAPDICFNQMPVVGSLTNEEIEVLRRWIVDIGD